MRHRTNHRKYFGCVIARCRVVAFAVPAATLTIIPALISPARADCWPPLNAREERQSNPVRVGKETFTTGYYSWSVESYRVDDLHCEESINEGPREWSAIVGLGGDEPIGPRITVDGKPTQSTLNRPNMPRNTAPATPLPALPALPPTQQLSPSLPTLPPPADLAALPPLSRTALPTLPALPELSAIPDAR